MFKTRDLKKHVDTIQHYLYIQQPSCNPTFFISKFPKIQIIIIYNKNGDSLHIYYIYISIFEYCLFRKALQETPKHKGREIFKHESKQYKCKDSIFITTTFWYIIS